MVDVTLSVSGTIQAAFTVDPGSLGGRADTTTTDVTVRITYNGNYLELGSPDPTPEPDATGVIGAAKWVEWSVTISGPMTFTLHFDPIQQGCSRLQGCAITPSTTSCAATEICNFLFLDSGDESAMLRPLPRRVPVERSKKSKPKVAKKRAPKG